MRNQEWRGQPSEKRPFKSFYGAGYVTGAHYLAEGMCGRMAKKAGKDLPPRFWSLPAWKRTFLHQMRLANGLIQIYSVQAIVAALKRLKYIYSLGCKMALDPIIQEEQSKLDLQAEKDVEAKKVLPVETTEGLEKTRIPFPAESNISNKLKDL